MGLNETSRRDIVQYRIERAFYSDKFNLTEEQIASKMKPTEDFVKIVTQLAREKIGI